MYPPAEDLHLDVASLLLLLDEHVIDHLCLGGGGGERVRVKEESGGMGLAGGERRRRQYFFRDLKKMKKQGYWKRERVDRERMVKNNTHGRSDKLRRRIFWG